MKKQNMKKDFVYFIQIGEPSERLFKIGTTNNMKRRMREHEKYYGKKVVVLWQSPAYSKWTTLRIEDKMKNQWIEEGIFEYLRNDRFLIPEKVKEVMIKVRKEYVVSI